MPRLRRRRTPADYQHDAELISIARLLLDQVAKRHPEQAGSLTAAATLTRAVELALEQAGVTPTPEP